MVADAAACPRELGIHAGDMLELMIAANVIEMGVRIEDFDR